MVISTATARRTRFLAIRQSLVQPVTSRLRRSGNFWQRNSTKLFTKQLVPTGAGCFVVEIYSIYQRELTAKLITLNVNFRISVEKDVFLTDSKKGMMIFCMCLKTYFKT